MINPHVFTAGCPTEAAGDTTDPATRIGGTVSKSLPHVLSLLAVLSWPAVIRRAFAFSEVTR